MKNIERIPDELGVNASWEQKQGSRWLKAESLDVRRMADLMNSAGARFITITAMEEPGGSGIRLDYHWDLNGELLSIVTHSKNNSIQSITDICEAADWTEREIHDGFSVEFAGRNCEPLLIRAGGAFGMQLHKEEE